MICVSQIIPHSTMKLRLKFTLLLSSRGTRYRGGSLHLQSLVISSVEPLLTFTLLYHWHRQIDTYNHEDNPHSGDFYSFYSINVCRRHLEVMETHGEKTVRILQKLIFTNGAFVSRSYMDKYTYHHYHPKLTNELFSERDNTSIQFYSR